MKATVQIDSTGFTGLVRDLSRISGKSFRYVLQQQTGALLTTAMRLQAKRLSKRQEMKARKTVRLTAKLNTVSQAGSGSVPYRLGGQQFNPASSNRLSVTKKGTWIGRPGAWHKVDGTRRMPDRLWAEQQALAAIRGQRLSQQLRLANKDIDLSYGLSVTSWWQCAEVLGIEEHTKVPQQRFKTAKPSNRRIYQNGRGMENTVGEAFFIEIQNDSPLTIGRRGADVLAQAMRHRLSAFNTDVRLGVFDDMKTRARRYPGVFVR